MNISRFLENSIKGEMDPDSKPLLDFIKEYNLYPPNGKPYNLSKPNVEDPSISQSMSKMVSRILDNKVI